MQKISIREEGGRLLVRIPFALKDSFKSRFKSATWAAMHTSWSVSPRSRKRLEQWIAEVEASGALEPAEDHDAREMSEQEVSKLRSDLESIKTYLSREISMMRSIEDIRADQSELLEKIAKMREDLAAAAKEVAEQRKTADAERAQIEATVATLINLGAVNASIRSMLWLANQPPKSRFREDFDEHAEVIRAEREKLRAAGLDSELMRVLGAANYNRKEKDVNDWRKPLTFHVIEE